MATKINYLDNQHLQELSEEELKGPATGLN